MTGARIVAGRNSVVFEDQGHFVSEITSSDFSTEEGFTVSFTMKQSGKLILREDLNDNVRGEGRGGGGRNEQ